jgi:transposase
LQFCATKTLVQISQPFRRISVPRVKAYLDLPHEERMRRRDKARVLLAAQVPGAVIARMLGLTKSGVSRWRRELESEGAERFTRDIKPGRAQSLSKVQCEVLVRCMRHKPSHYGIKTRGDLWTWAALVVLADQELSVQCVRQTIARSFERFGFSL